jgi:CRISPR-associated Csx2 family protein
MTHCLVSLLGRAGPDPATGYRRASYRFEDGSRVDDVSYFGLALKRYVKPDTMVVLGTSGSMWDVFIEAFAEGGAREAERLALIDKAASAAVSEADLESLRGLVEAGLGLPVQLGVIPYGRDTGEQAAILRRLLDAVDGADRVTLDLTHGFRHLPMLGLLCALFLEQVRGIRVEAIYYGALEMTEDEVTPVLRLDGLLHMARWLQALHTYDKDGDYGVFRPLFETEGMAQAGLLDEAAFYERTTNPVKARECLAGFNSDLDSCEGPVGGAVRAGPEGAHPVVSRPGPGRLGAGPGAGISRSRRFPARGHLCPGGLHLGQARKGAGRRLPRARRGPPARGG